MRKIFILIVVISNIAIIFGQNAALFDSYISKFKEVQTDTIDNNYFRSQDEIDKEFIKFFITNKQDCKCVSESLWYQYAFKIEKKDFIIAFIYKNCDIPSSSGNYPYSDVILIVYSKKGEIIDTHVISRGGDLWQCNYSGSTDPFRLIVEQASTPKKEFEKRKNYPLPCEIRTSEFEITKEGQIKQTVVSERKGTIIWDKTTNKSLIVKDNN